MQNPRVIVRNHGRLLGALTLGFAALGAGCFGIGDVDRTNPDKVLKSTFFNDDGTPASYYFRQTVIDVPATSGVTFIGEQSDTELVVFEITEDYLYARRAYGFLQNDSAEGAVDGNQGDGYVRPGTGTYDGAPIAAFRIQSHFDVKRQYNPQTGEQTNVLYEDSSDRPWYQRDYIRVDWSSNVVADFRFSGVTAVQQASATAVDVPSEDQNEGPNYDRPTITPEYIDTVTGYDVLPESYYFDGYGAIPQCYFYSSIYKDCMGGTIKVRNSFRKKVETGYVPLDYDDKRFQKFGFFRTERYTYNDQYGVVEPAVVRLANRWNLWDDAASCHDPEADLPYAGCDPADLKPIVYYLNADFPRDPPNLLEVARGNGDEWNRVLRQAVLDSTGWSEDTLGDRRMFVLCDNNPVQAGDPAECGPEGLSPQIGDLRYSMYYYIPNFQFAPPLGYGPSAADPMTGEIIQGNAFYYGAAGATIAARTRDAIQLQLGILEEEDITGGIPATEAVAAARAAASASSDMARDMGSDISDKVRDMADNMRIPDKIRRLRDQVASGQAMHDKRPSRLEALKNSGLDELVLTDELREVFSGHLLEEGLLGSEADSFVASRLFDDEALFRRERERRMRMLMPAARGCILSMEDVFDDGLLGLTQKVRSKFYDVTTDPPTLKTGMTEQDVYNFILAMTMGDTQLHEIGHTMGLRHNFSGSTDALNFGPKYWELRGYTRTSGAARPQPQWAISAGLRASYEQALTEGLRDNQDSTVMDYASTYGTTLELGSYDLAAIKYAYGDVVETFNSPDVSAARAELLQPGQLHYLYYPEVVSNGATYEERVAAMYDRASVNYRNVGERIEVPYSFCSDEYRDASATCAIWDQGADNFERTVYAAEHYKNYALFNQFKRQRLTFGVDVWGYLSRVYTTDFTYMLNQYKNWLNEEFFVHEDEPCMAVEGGQIVNTSDDRFAADACGLAGFLGTVEAVNLLAQVIQSPDVGCYVRLQPGCYDTVSGNGDPRSAPDDIDIDQVSTDPAACDAYVPTQPADPDATRRVALKITDKTPYAHVALSTSCEGYSARPFMEEPVEIGYSRGGARPANTLYNRDEYGYYFYIKPIVIGSWWDKWLAVKALGDPNTDFIGVDSASDPKSFLISMNTIFGDDINSLIGGVITDNTDRYGAVLSEDNQVETVPFLDINSGGPFNRGNLDRPAINPDQPYTLQLLALFNATYSGQTTDDFEFGESIGVGSAYNITDVSIPDAVRSDPTRYTELTDPVSGMKWFALNQQRDADGFYSIGFSFIREIKNRYFVGGANGPGTQLQPAFQGQFNWMPRRDIERLRVMSTTANVFGWADVWSGDIEF